MPDTQADLRIDLERLLASHVQFDAGAEDRLARVLAAPTLAAALGASADARIGQRLGPYRLVGVLGAGGMGTVYRAERDAGGFTQAVALKIVDGAIINPALRARFELERQILARLRPRGEAFSFVGRTTLTTDATGRAGKTVYFADPGGNLGYVSASATSLDSDSSYGDTSEIGACVAEVGDAVFGYGFE